MSSVLFVFNLSPETFPKSITVFRAMFISFFYFKNRVMSSANCVNLIIFIPYIYFTFVPSRSILFLMLVAIISATIIKSRDEIGHP